MTDETVTARLVVDPDAIDGAAMATAATILRRGGLVAFPTETVYGLGCVAFDPAAVARVFDAKGRPATDPLIVHVLAGDDLDGVVERPPPLFAELARAFWPGPLTLVARRGPRVPDQVAAGLATVAVRAPAHPVAEALLAAVGTPIAAPSANRFGHVSPTSADHVLADLAGRCDLVLDGGDSTLGVESTVVAVADDHVTLLRPGALPVEDLEALGCRVVIGDGVALAAAPGHEVRHYAPDAEMWTTAPGATPPLPGPEGVYLGYADAPPALPAGWRFVPLGRRDEIGGVAARLYRILRSLDGGGPVVAELTGATGLGRAIDDRLSRAASGRRLGSS